MTYIEKIMQAIKVDRELLSEEAARRLKEVLIRLTIMEDTCPGSFFSSVPCPLESTPKMSCEDCWKQEARGGLSNWRVKVRELR